MRGFIKILLLSFILTAFLNCPAQAIFCSTSDLSIDGIVDFEDLVLLCDQWLQQGCANPYIEAHWKLDDSGATASDSSGNNCDGTLAGSPNWTEGIHEGALHFNGSGDYVDIPHFDLTANWTICFWVKGGVTNRPDELTGSMVLGNKYDGYNYFYMIDNARARIKNASGNIVSWYNDNDFYNNWRFVALAADDTGIELYLDGVSQGYKTIDPNFKFYTFGAGFSTDDYDFIGSIDNIFLYNKLLNPEEITTLAITGSNTYHCADLDNANGVNMADFAIMANNWHEQVGPLIISEFMTSNETTIHDGDGFYSDWIEIQNISGAEVNLAGWSLTDNPENLTKWRFPDEVGVSLKPDEFLLVFASNKSDGDYPYVDSLGKLHTNFSLSTDGEYLALVRPDGTIAYEYNDNAGVYPPQFEDVSYGMVAKVGTGWFEFINGYFLEPTPLEENGTSEENLGPLVRDMQFSPHDPENNEDIIVTVKVTETFAPLDTSKIVLHYCEHFYMEYTTEMVDDGTGSDEQAGDDIYTGVIPESVAGRGQMVRWYITAEDTDDRQTRWPPFYNPQDSAEYFGTVVNDPWTITDLPILHWFIKSENVSAADTLDGTRCCVYFNGEFYDNVFCRVRGGSTAQMPCPSHKIDFNRGHHFRFDPQFDRVSEININTNYTEKAYVRQTLSFETYRKAGVPACQGELVRVEQNGNFYSLDTLIEQVDEDFLQRNNLDQNGAMYKMFSTGANPSYTSFVSEKKTRKYETNKDDLLTFLNSLILPSSQRRTYIFDNVDLPEVVNYIAATIMVSDVDCPHKNHYYYRDSDGNGEWKVFPWDKDLSFGHNWDNTSQLYQDTVQYDCSHRACGNNTLINAIYNTPVFDEMYLCRIRTLMEEILQPPDTPAQDLLLEQRLDEIQAKALSDANRDYLKWGNPWTRPSYATSGDWYPTLHMDEAIEMLKNDHLAPRRVFLFESCDIRPPSLAILTLVDTDDSKRVRVPTGTIDDNWKGGGTFDDSSWTLGTGGVGYERGSGYEPYIDIDVENDMYNKNATCYIRIPFSLTSEQLAGIEGLELKMMYDDGFVAYINGSEVHRENFSGTPTWNSDCSFGSEVTGFVYFDIYEHINKLNVGNNVLAIHGMNEYKTSSDFLIAAELVTTNPVSGSGVNFADIEYNPASGNQNEEYIEIHNSNTAIDISGWKITGGVEYTFKPGTVIPSAYSIYVSPDVVAFRNRSTGPSAGQNKFVQGPYKGHLSNWPETLKLIDDEDNLVCSVTYTGNPSDQQKFLRVTEIMYHPNDPCEGSSYIDEDFEFIELKNIDTSPLLLAGVKFTNGVLYDFGSVSLSADDYLVVVSNPSAFAERYPDVPSQKILGPYTGSLSNGGEKIKLEDSTSSTILEFSYNDSWFPITDGHGFSLTAINADEPNLNMWNDKNGWRPSSNIGGTPTEEDTGVFIASGAVLINEILAHADTQPCDWIELHNTTGNIINIGGWFLSDSASNLKKYEIEAGKSIAANGYVVFTEDDHFGVGGEPNAFALNENGETVYLTSGLNGELTSYSEDQSFGASEKDVSFGLYHISSTDSNNFVAMSSMSPNSVNVYPKVGPVVISEFMYHPETDGDAEYIELYNISGSPVTLQKYDAEEDEYVAWKFTSGIEFTFPLGTTLSAGERLLVIKDSDAFNSEYTNVPAVQIFVWHDGSLSNGGEDLELSIPGDIEGIERQYILIDKVKYSDGSHPEDCPGGIDLWPSSADGDGDSLERKNPSTFGQNYGNDVGNWQAETIPSPGQ